MSMENPLFKNGSLLSFFQKKETWQEISGYHVGNIHSPDIPVLIPEGSTVVGDVFAPKIIVAGLLCGTLVSSQTEIKETGQIWGDLFTVSVTIKPGGKIQGWVNTVDEETAVSLQSDGIVPEDQTDSEAEKFINETVGSEHLSNRTSQEISTYHLLQTEIANALAARAEIEHTFDERIKEVAGGSSEKIQSLSEQLDSYQSDNINLTTDLAQTKETLTQKEAQLERHEVELELTREQISQLQQKNEEIKQEYAKLSEKRTELETANNSLNKDLTAAMLNIDKLTNRIQSVEEAMKGSLQHSSELQESLERWQELAEVTEAKAKTLEEQIATLTFQQEESEKQMEILREQKKQAESEWHKAQSDLDALRSESGFVANEAATELFIDEASIRMAQLEETLLEMAQERAEQQLWFEVNLENRLLQVNELTEQIASLNGSAEQSSEQLTEQLVESQAEVDALKSQLEAAQEKFMQAKNQAEASEADLKYHLDAIEKQGSHLAEIQERLAEREVQLMQAGKLLKKQKLAFQEFKEKAAVHIKKLQAKLKEQKTA